MLHSILQFFFLRELILQIEVNPQHSQKLEPAKFSCYMVLYLFQKQMVIYILHVCPLICSNVVVNTNNTEHKTPE